MKNIVVFKKTEELHKYDLWITFDKQEELDLWLETTLENKDNLMIMQTFKRREKGYKCIECGEISSAEDIDNSTKNHFGGDIVSISSIYREGSDFICPKCKEVIEGSCFRKVD
jgi:succinate dehydrogenase/fumarate reductase-like Fe-S protein